MLLWEKPGTAKAVRCKTTSATGPLGYRKSNESLREGKKTWCGDIGLELKTCRKALIRPPWRQTSQILQMQPRISKELRPPQKGERGGDEEKGSYQGNKSKQNCKQITGSRKIHLKKQQKKRWEEGRKSSEEGRKHKKVQPPPAQEKKGKRPLLKLTDSSF